MIGSWNTASAAYGKREGWDDDEQTNKVMIVQTLTTAGAAVGALFSGAIAGLGRWNCLMVCNAVLVAGAALTLVDEFPVLCIGRFIYGLSVGGFSVFCPKYIAETAPIEIKGPAGALSQVCITLGILIAFSVGLGIGDADQDDVDSFEIQYYWYIIFAIPVGIAAIQVLLLLFVFPYDTPPVLKQNGDDETLLELMRRIYETEDIVQERIGFIVVDGKDDGEDKELTYSVICCSPKYRRATLVGCFLSVFQQLTGINAIMFYSNMLFKGLSMTNTQVTFLIGIVNFVATLVGLVLLIWFGRRLLMLIFNAAMTLTLLLLAIYSFQKNSIGMIVCVLLFIAFFEFSSGPIVWLYNAEIMRDKAVAIATFLNWFVSLIISVCIPFLVKKYDIGWIFLSFALFTLLGTIFIAIFMKETRGKTQAEIDELFDDSEKDDYKMD